MTGGENTFVEAGEAIRAVALLFGTQNTLPSSRRTPPANAFEPG